MANSNNPNNLPGNRSGPSGGGGNGNSPNDRKEQYFRAIDILDAYIKNFETLLSDPAVRQTIEQAPDVVLEGRTPKQMVVDNLINGFAEMMRDVPKNELPVEFFQAMLRHRNGKAPNKKLAAAQLDKEIAKVANSSDLQLESAELFGLVWEKAHPQDIGKLIRHRRMVLEEGKKLLLSDTALAADRNLEESAGSLAMYFNQRLQEWASKNNMSAPGRGGVPAAPNSAQKDDADQGVRIHRVEDLEDVDTEMDQLIGMEKPKAMIEEIRARVEHTQMLKRAGLAPAKASEGIEHYIFDGNPGTGKTTFARLIGKIYQEAGLLEKGHVVEADRGSMVAGFVGQTALKVKEVVNQALDGVLFVDEAYLLDGDGKDFGKEAMGTLLKQMEMNKDRLVVVLAGYPNEMDNLVKSNPGLTRRFKYFMNFPDFSEGELMDILDLNLQKRNLEITDDAREKVKTLLDGMKKTDGQNFGNAGAVENVVDLLVSKLALDLKQKGLLEKFQSAASNDNKASGKKAKNTPDPAWAKQLVTITADIVEKLEPKAPPVPPKAAIGFDF